LPCSPKKNLNQGSLLRGLFLAALLVLMLTTAAEDFCAANLKLPVGTTPEFVAAASSMATVPEPDGRFPNQSGLSVPTTKYVASNTVTVWENNNQKRFIKILGKSPFAS
jgi:hypothetical protein